MKSRLLVAALLIPPVLYVISMDWQHGLAFALLVTVVTLLALNELYQMFRPQQPFVLAGLIAGGMVPLMTWLIGLPGIFIGMVVAIPLTMIFQLLSVERRDPVTSIAVTLMGVLYVSLFAGLAVELHSAAHGAWLIVLVLAGVWLTDTGAYVGGRLLGRHKLAPRISPNKTIEGFVCGTALGTFVVWYSHWLPEESWLGNGWDTLFIGIAISLSTTVGDLFESLLKRSVGVKDSGRLLGEHGGFLDRIDSLLLAVPVTYLATYLLGTI